MFAVGVVELIIVALILLISLSIPTVTLVVAILIYRKLQRIEERLRLEE